MSQIVPSAYVVIILGEVKHTKMCTDVKKQVVE